MQDKLKPEPEDASVPKTPRMPTPPLSSMDSVKRARWPHQNSRTPTPAPLSKSSKWEITLKRRRTPSRFPSRALAACAGGDHISNAENMHSAKMLKSRKTDSPRKAPLLSQQKLPAAKNMIPVTPSLWSAPGLMTAKPTFLITNNVTFHFYLADEAKGAIPKAFSSCNTTYSFFDEALAA